MGECVKTGPRGRGRLYRFDSDRAVWMASFHSTPSGLRRIARVFQGLRGVPLTPGYYIRGLQPQRGRCLSRFDSDRAGWMASFHSTPSGLRRIARVFQGLRGVPLTPGYYIRGLQPQQRQMLVPARIRPGRLDALISYNPFRVGTDPAHLPGVARNTADPRL